MLVNDFEEFKRLARLDEIEMPIEARVLIKRAFYCGAAAALLTRSEIRRQEMMQEIGTEATAWAAGCLKA